MGRTRLIWGTLVLALRLAAPAGAQVQPYGTNDGGGFRNPPTFQQAVEIQSHGPR